MEIDFIGGVLIGLVLLLTSIILMNSMGIQMQTSFTRNIKEALDNFYTSVVGNKYYDICAAYDGEYVSIADFQNLLNAYYKNQCGNYKAEIILSFSLSKEDIIQMARELGIAGEGKMVIFDHAEPLGVGAIIVDGNYSEESIFQFRADDRIKIWSEGYPKKDVLMNITGTECDYESGVCQPRRFEIDQWGCTITKSKLKGDICECNSECKRGLFCDKSGAGSEKEPDGILGHCCPPGETWSGTNCGFKNTFTIYYFKAKEGPAGSVMSDQEFISAVARINNTWIEKTKLKECSGAVGVKICSNICEIPEQDPICDPQDPMFSKTFEDTMKAIEDCKKNCPGVEARVVAILDSTSICVIPSKGSVNGYTAGHGYPVLVAKSDAGRNLARTTIHELGHTFDLCDEGYGGADCSIDYKGKQCMSGYCSPQSGGAECTSQPKPICCPNRPEMNSVMCEMPSICNHKCSSGESFASYSKKYLDIQLAKYCE